jgi:hypothetical protein
MEFIYNFENLEDKPEVLVEKGREVFAYISYTLRGKQSSTVQI